MLKTPLYDAHIALGAKLVPFAGWEMPLSYRGILEEHKAVRTAIGLFDVSHMGRIKLRGPQAAQFIDEAGTNAIADKANDSAIYTVFCREDGTAVDDAVVLRHTSEYCSVIANAANRDKLLKHLQHYAVSYHTDIIAPDLNEGIIALQGPRARELATTIMPEIALLHFMHSKDIGDLIVARTGYTGEMGFEFFGPGDKIVELWQRLLTEGAERGIEPTGLGARDTLRIEMGYALYGHELTDTIAPSESVAAWTIKWKKGHFIGREALVALENSGRKRHPYGLMLPHGIPRAGNSIWRENNNIGIVTSGTFSPTLQTGIAIAMVEDKMDPSASVEVEIRGHRHPAFITKLPFYTNGSQHVL